MWEIQQQQQQQRHYRSAGSSASESQSGLAGPATRGSVGAGSAGGGGVMHPPGMPSTSEDLHAWSIYRQNLNVSCFHEFFLEQNLNVTCFHDFFRTTSKRNLLSRFFKNSGFEI